MAIAPRDQTRRFGSLQVLVAPQRRPATAVGTCLTALVTAMLEGGFRFPEMTRSIIAA